MFDGTSIGIHTVKGGKGTSARSCKTSEKVATSDITNTTADLSAWTDATTPSGEAASAQANAAAVVQYYASQYLWMSYDGKGSTITSIINQNCSSDDGVKYDLNSDNAYWDGEKSMHHGDGAGGVRRRSWWWQTQRHHVGASEHFGTLAMHPIIAAKELKLPLQSIACAWVAVGALTDSWVRSSAARRRGRWGWFDPLIRRREETAC